jgi:hypothetical protein
MVMGHLDRNERQRPSTTTAQQTTKEGEKMLADSGTAPVADTDVIRDASRRDPPGGPRRRTDGDGLAMTAFRAEATAVSTSTTTIPVDDRHRRADHTAADQHLQRSCVSDRFGKEIRTPNSKIQSLVLYH